ncbi:MAG: Phosphatidate cytidylyltransferase [Paracidovorax wautersii]|uniref:Phosphatidate cytidylyltransferase n=1 Tax=Paracidovorax wautersii TaxID=1177982 RepID=A0A7V8JS50_9BURK|nr:MAG: Phosphatidate cytidylyltransferase [Paracidovorax wautersii]
MLKQRIITAIVLLLIVMAALLSPAVWPFLALALVLVGAAGWEWGRLNGLGQGGAVGLAVLTAAVAAASWWGGLPMQDNRLLWLAAGAAWVVVIVALLRAGVPAWQRLPQALRLAGGVLFLWLAWLAIAQARVMGVGLLLSVFAIVWAADIAAYFAGRAFSQKVFARKLAPAISPGKSWEGALGGIVAVVALGWIWTAVDASAASVFARLQGQGVVLFVLALLFLTLVSIAGDLIESLVKRSAGVKDSSQLLPGHGGVLDRIDAVLPTFPVAMMLLAVLS